MKIEKPTNQQWYAFCKRVIETEGNPSTQDAADCGIPFGYWFEIIARTTKNQLLVNARNTITELERRKLV